MYDTNDVNDNINDDINDDLNNDVNGDENCSFRTKRNNAKINKNLNIIETYI